MKTKVFAHYLPQFHRIRENSEWWSPGFTEWTNVAKARGLFPGHYQPHIPADLGFYDLSRPDIMHEQAALAHSHGIDGFNFYFYWFDGRRILETPLENFLNSDVDIEFSLCWANENWTRRWDGADKEVLLAQTYEHGFEDNLFRDLFPYFEDPRYLRVDSKPVLSIYRAQEIPNAKAVFENLRNLAIAKGLPGLHLVAVESFGLANPQLVGADAMMEFPPHGVGAECIVSPPSGIDDNFVGQMMDYRWAVKNASEKPDRDFVFYRGLMPSWDNTARTGLRSHFFVNSNPKAFKVWMDFALAWTRNHFTNNNQGLVFINAWNEWAEGAHLEPDLKYGHGYLEAVLESVKNDTLSLPVSRRAVNRLVNLQDSSDDVGSQLPRKNSNLDLFRSLAREVNLNNLKQIVRLIRKDPSGRELLEAITLAIAAVKRVNGKEWAPSSFLKEVELGILDWEAKTLFICHLHFPEYLQRFIALVKSFPETANFAVTSDNPEILSILLSANLSNVKIVKSVNRGRNFGPLLVEMEEDIRRYKYVVHLHSKRSSYSSRDFAQKWSNLHWEMLGENKEVFFRTLAHFESNEDIAIGYPLAIQIVKPSRFNWFKNKPAAIDWFETSGLDFVDDPFPYPAGGMFIFRTEALEKLLDSRWNYEDFPEEAGQLDGTTQHMIERLVGAIPLALGFKHLVYVPGANKFTTDSSFAQRYSGE